MRNNVVPDGGVPRGQGELGHSRNGAGFNLLGFERGRRSICRFAEKGSAILLPWLYYAILESSKLQGTFGKKALGIIVVDQNYERVTFLRASGRFWSRIISMLTIYVGYIMAAFTQRKQALHDIIAKTYVVDKKVLELSKGNPELYLNGVHMQGQQA
ncbi:RDD family protein [Paenibacillus woosongensis]|uniref:RDD family protein n=1 Tax=Paenibacillus woosongensis TaxID=307580 RepID=A0A7X2YYF3_9BACL|nr:RDD family protein [Paenibacillus woosongensis]MUG44326.1 RDD family protein [Paenibacillus woosongensis]